MDARFKYLERLIGQAEDQIVVAELTSLRTTGRERDAACREIADAKRELAGLKAQVAVERAKDQARNTPEHAAALVARQVERLRQIY